MPTADEFNHSAAGTLHPTGEERDVDCDQGEVYARVEDVYNCNRQTGWGNQEQNL